MEADPLLKEILINKIEQQYPQPEVDLLSEVEILIRQSLQSQQYQIDKIAKHLSLHPRTLQRKLQDLGISYSGLLEKIRRSIVQERLANANISITQLSDYLGYADNTALTRAFKRWFGITPTEWKKNTKHNFEQSMMELLLGKSHEHASPFWSWGVYLKHIDARRK